MSTFDPKVGGVSDTPVKTPEQLEPVKTGKVEPATVAPVEAEQKPTGSGYSGDSKPAAPDAGLKPNVAGAWKSKEDYTRPLLAGDVGGGETEGVSGDEKAAMFGAAIKETTPEEARRNLAYAKATLGEERLYNDLKDGAPDLDKVVEDNPGDDKVNQSASIIYEELGNLEAKFGEKEKAADYLWKAADCSREAGEKKSELYCQAGQLYQQTGHPVVAEDSLKSALQNDPKNNAAKFSLAEVYNAYGDGESDEAWKLYGEIAKDPNSSKEDKACAKAMLGSMLIEDGRYEEGLRELKEAKSLDKNCAEVKLYAGIVKFGKAKTAADRYKAMETIAKTEGGLKSNKAKADCAHYKAMSFYRKAGDAEKNSEKMHNYALAMRECKAAKGYLGTYKEADHLKARCFVEFGKNFKRIADEGSSDDREDSRLKARQCFKEAKTLGGDGSTTAKQELAKMDEEDKGTWDKVLDASEAVDDWTNEKLLSVEETIEGWFK